MRLAPKDVQKIKETFQSIFLEDDHLWFFGSRVDNQKRGGDIDLYIETMDDDIDQVIKRRLKFVGLLLIALGERKMDVVINQLSRPYGLPIYRIAKETGVLIL